MTAKINRCISLFVVCMAWCVCVYVCVCVCASVHEVLKHQADWCLLILAGGWVYGLVVALCHSQVLQC
jgi:hypothetical protein